ncbi:MAG: ABC transporter substrate-binding protein [Methanocorpusculum sp.]|nr:ABC transporter substrate-binding protein [Methanocorpusculum sp.]
MNKKAVLFGVGILLVLAAILTAGCVDADTSKQPGVELVIISSGMQVNSLVLGQADCTINWQPNVAAAEVSGVGKVISYSQDLPRNDGKSWKDHPCCVFGANEEALKNRDLTVALTALLMKANQYINEHPDKAAADVANWIYGNTDPVFGNISVKGTDITSASIPTIHFTTEVTDKWRDDVYTFIQIYRSNGSLIGTLKATSRKETEAIIYDQGIYQASKEVAASGVYPTLKPTDEIKIGYLLSDHDAPLFVLIKEWEYFKENGNTYLKPDVEKYGQIERAEFYVNGKKICDVSFVQGTAGTNLTTMMQTNSIQYAVAGLTPFLSSIDTRKGLKILAPVMTEGSALITPRDAPINNWEELIAWAKKRSADGNPLLIAIPEANTIQDLMLRYALATEGLGVKMKGA